MNPPEAGAAPAPARRGWGAPVAGVAVSALLLWWAVRGVDVGAAWNAARAASPGWLLAGVATATAMFVLRVPRWQLLLRSADGAALAAGPAWHGIAIGFMANNLIPRSGEFLRAWTVTRLAPFGFTASLSSVAVERVFDGLTLAALLAVALLSPSLPPDAMIGDTALRTLAVRAGLACLVLLAVAVVMVSTPGRAERLARRLIPWPRLADRVAGVIHGVAEGLGAMRSAPRLAAVVLWSLLLWGAGALSFWLVARAFGLALDPSAVLLIQGVLAFGVALPSTPGYVGVFEALIVAVLTLFGIERDLAFAYAVTYHVTTFLPITALGLLSVVRTPIALGDLRRQRA